MNRNFIPACLSICFCLLASSACTVKRIEGPAQRIKLLGLNDSAYYYIFRNRGEVVTVMKDEYTQYGEYIIQISRDTVTLGNEFVATFSIYKPKYRISIEEPRMELIEGGANQELKSDNRNFVFSTDKVGSFSLKGQLWSMIRLLFHLSIGLLLCPNLDSILKEFFGARPSCSRDLTFLCSMRKLLHFPVLLNA